MRLSKFFSSMIAVLCVSLALAASASARITHPLIGWFGQFSNVQSIAVDESSGDVYVYDTAAGGTIYKFDSSGQPANFSALGTNVIEGVGVGLFDEEQLAVDNSTKATHGDIYVASPNRLGIYGPDGKSLGELTSAVESEVPAAAGTWGYLCGVAVDSSGNVYVSAFYARDVNKYTPTGNPVVNTDYVSTLNQNTTGMCNIAVDGEGSLYTAGWPRGGLFKYGAAQFGTSEAIGGQVSETGSTIAVNPSDNELYVYQNDGHGHGDVAQFESDGTQVDSLGPYGETVGVAVNGAAHKIYVSDGQVVQVYDGARTLLPEAATGDTSDNETGHSVTLHGTLNPEGTATTWQFLYGTSKLYGSTVPASSQDAGEGTSEVAVNAELTGLQPGTTYYYRLKTTNADGSQYGGERTFTTPSVPAAEHESVTGVEQEAVTLLGHVNPHGIATNYRFEYGPTEAYGSRAPTPDALAGYASGDVIVRQDVTGLLPNSTYHYRLVATSAAGTVATPDHVFHTLAAPLPTSHGCPNEALREEQGSTFLPECRAYEMVSPQDKNGEDVIPDSARTRAAAEETPGLPMAVTFGSLSAFGDVQGTSVATEYMSVRSTASNPGTNGWSTHGIFPRQEPTTAISLLYTNRSMWEGQLSPNLTEGVFRGISPVNNEDPNVANVRNLYYRDDLRTAGAGSYKLITPCLTCTSPLPDDTLQSWTTIPELVGSSSDFSHILYESQYRLAEGATPGQPNLFDWYNGTLHLAGILPDGTPAECSVGGHGMGTISNPLISPRSISEDGSRIFFTANQDGGECGSSWSGSPGNIYMREDDGTPQAKTVQLNQSEKVPAEAPQPAFFWTATPDGSHIFFTSREELTAGANEKSNLYMYDATKPASDPHNLTLIGTDGNSVYGVSDDGSTVYFEADNRAFVWHDGVVAPITKGPVSSGDYAAQQNAPLTSVYMERRYEARVTSDGRYLLFRSAFDPTTGEPIGSTCENGSAAFLNPGNFPCAQLFLYSLDTGKSTCVSCTTDGAEPTSEAVDTAWYSGGGAYTARYLNRPLSIDGTRVFFSTRAALVPADINGKVDAYEYNLTTNTVSLLSTGQGTTDSYFMDASASGNDVFIATDQRLVGWDKDDNYDLYDVRVDGGFPEPAAVRPACASEDCRRQSTPALAAPTVASLTFSGSGNVGPTPKPKPKPKSKSKSKPKQVKCRRGRVRNKVKGHVRCVVVGHGKHGARRGK
jgi:hypothetical protein